MIITNFLKVKLPLIKHRIIKLASQPDKNYELFLTCLSFQEHCALLLIPNDKVRSKIEVLLREIESELIKSRSVK